MFEKYALHAAEEIFQQHHIAVMVGGTGLYINAFCNGIDEIPNIAIEIRNNIIENYAAKGLTWLQEEIKTKDPDFWQTAEQQNPQRLMRALEVVEATGKSINHFRNHQSVERPFNIIKIGLELPRETLIQNINERVDKMMADGLIDEVASLIHHQQLNALQTVGYRELFDYFNGHGTKKQAIEKIKISTRQYAKRQMTWFKKDEQIKWIHPTDEFDINSFNN